MKRTSVVSLIRWLLVFVLIVGGTAGAWFLARRWISPEVMVTNAVEAPVVQAFYATGTLMPEREYPIRANNPGSVTQVLVDKGDRVAKDQPVAVVSEDGVQQRFNQAKAERDLKAQLASEQSPVLQEFDARIAASAELIEIARREQTRIAAALEQRAASASDLDKALDRIKTLTSEAAALKAQRAARKLELEKDLEVAEAALKIAQWNVDRQTIRSPIDGVVLDWPLTVGTRVAVNDPIMVVADVRPEMLVMRAAVDEEDKTLVHLGQTVQMTLYAYPDRALGEAARKDRVFMGRVKKVYPKADPDRRTFEVDVEMVEKDPGFAAGMTGELAFIVDQKSHALVIPSQAVQAGGVWVVHEGKLAKAKVQIGLRSVERVEVVSGLRGDELVVISPIGNLGSGQAVRTSRVDPLEAAEQNRQPDAEGSSFKGFK